MQLLIIILLFFSCYKLQVGPFSAICIQGVYNSWKLLEFKNPPGNLLEFTGPHENFCVR